MMEAVAVGAAANGLHRRRPRAEETAVAGAVAVGVAGAGGVGHGPGVDACRRRPRYVCGTTLLPLLVASHRLRAPIRVRSAHPATRTSVVCVATRVVVRRTLCCSCIGVNGRSRETCDA